MADNEVKNITPSDAAPATEQSVVPESHIAPKQPQVMSKGEKIFNWGVYSGMNYWLNLAMSVVITDIFKNRGGKRFLHATADKIAHGLSSTKLFSPADAFHHSKTALETFMLLSGGNILLVPLKYLEDRKRPIVHWINKKLGVDQKAPDGHELTPDEIYIKEQQPKQSWGRIIWRRVLGIVAVVGVGHAINGAFRDRTKPLPLRDEPDIHGGKERITNWVMGDREGKEKGINSALRHIPGLKWMVNSDRAQAYMSFTVLDSVFTAITALIMRVTNGAKKNGHAEKENLIETIVPPADTHDTVPAATITNKISPENFKRQKETAKPESLTHAQRIASEQTEVVQVGV